MTRTRNISDLLDSNGDVKVTSLDNAPAVDLTNLSATHLTSGTIPAARFPSTIDGRDLSTDGTKLDGIEASATADQTASEIRALVESASDSNVFTDADHTKLNGIEASATADQTASEIKTLVESASDSNVFTDADHTKLNGISAGATADDLTNLSATNLTSGTIPDARFPATIAATTVDLGDWTITESGGVLFFATSGTNKMKLDASGNLTVVGDVTAFGSM